METNGGVQSPELSMASMQEKLIRKVNVGTATVK